MNTTYLAIIVIFGAVFAFAGTLHYYDAHVYPPADGVILIDGEAFRPYPHTDNKPEYVKKHCVSTINSTGDHMDLCS